MRVWELSQESNDFYRSMINLSALFLSDNRIAENGLTLTTRFSAYSNKLGRRAATSAIRDFITENAHDADQACALILSTLPLPQALIIHPLLIENFVPTTQYPELLDASLQLATGLSNSSDHAAGCKVLKTTLKALAAAPQQPETTTICRGFAQKTTEWLDARATYIPAQEAASLRQEISAALTCTAQTAPPVQKGLPSKPSLG